MKTEDIEYSFGAKKFSGYLVYDETKTGKRPGVLVVHEAWGLGEHVKLRAERLAQLGYVAFCADMLGGGRQLTNAEEMMSELGALFADTEEFHGRARAALAVLAGRPEVDATRLGGIGFCMGGTTVLELARNGADLRGVMSFHGGLTPLKAATPGSVKAKVISATGADDPMIPAEQVQAFESEMRAAGADWEVILYGGTVHSFTNAKADGSIMPAILYNAQADKRSWATMVDFFAEVFA
jgi:dienelactone hydrolase